MSAARRQNIKRGWGDDLAPIPVSKIDAELFGALREIEGDQLIMRDNQIQVGAFTLTSNGLEMNRETDREEWGKIGDLLFRLEGSIQWLIGDWLTYGESLAYGDLKARVEATGRDYNTVRNYMVVCRAFTLSRRRYNLSFGHYQAAAGIEDETMQDEALAFAADNGLSVAAFRKAIHGEQPPTLSAGENFFSIAKEASKLMQSDPSTLKPKDRNAGLKYIARMRAVFDAWEAKARS